MASNTDKQTKTQSVSANIDKQIEADWAKHDADWTENNVGCADKMQLCRVCKPQIEKNKAKQT